MILPQDIQINSRFIDPEGNEMIIAIGNIDLWTIHSYALKGVPLTREHLIKAGLTSPHENNVFYLGSQISISHIPINREPFVVFYNYQLYKNISFLHEFQSLIFELIRTVVL